MRLAEVLRNLEVNTGDAAVALGNPAAGTWLHFCWLVLAFEFGVSFRSYSFSASRGRLSCPHRGSDLSMRNCRLKCSLKVLLSLGYQETSLD